MTQTHSTGRHSSFALAFKCCCIATNALTAGGIFCFPLYSESLAHHLRLSQPQLSTIVLAGMMGQYPFSVIFGTLVDKWGPWACSLASSFLFSIGFGLFALEISRTGYIQPGDPSLFRHLVFYYFIAGLGTVSGYFSALFSASQVFPHRSGIATGVSTSLFGLSPLFLSFLASTFFTNPETGLNVPRFIAFLALFAGSFQLLGSYGLRIQTSTSTEEAAGDEGRLAVDNPGEEEPLLQRKVHLPGSPCQVDQSVLVLFSDIKFWVLATVVLLTLGACEMVITNIGTVVLSLSPRDQSKLARPVATTVATQVRLLSLSNTLSRLFTGPLADILSPVPLRLPCGALCYPRKRFLSRLAFIAAASLVLVATFAWTAIMIKSRDSIWVLSVGAGLAYGTIFTVLPSITASLWGGSHFGRNFSLISYAPFFGTPIFSYIYAFVAAHHTTDVVCLGIQCCRTTFLICAFAALVATVLSCGLWRQARGRV